MEEKCMLMAFKELHILNYAGIISVLNLTTTDASLTVIQIQKKKYRHKKYPCSYSYYHL